MSMQEKMQRLKLTTLPKLKRPVADQMSLTDESFPDEVKQVVHRRNVDSIVYHKKKCGVKASYTVAYKKQTKTQPLQLMNFLLLTNKTFNLCSVSSLF